MAWTLAAYADRTLMSHSAGKRKIGHSNKKNYKTTWRRTIERKEQKLDGGRVIKV